MVATKQLFLNMSTCLFLLGFSALPTFAADGIDCTKAVDKIEIAICNSDGLKEKDRQLAETFSKIKDQTFQDKPLPEQKAFIVDDQKAWIKARTKTCGATSGQDLATCVETQIDQRQAQLAHDWGLSEEDKDVLKAGGLTLGSTFIPAKQGDVTEGLDDQPQEYAYALGADADKPLRITSSTDRGETPFRALYRLRQGSAEAALLQIADRDWIYNGSLYQIVTASPDAPAKVIDLGNTWDDFGEDGIVYRGAQGFSIEFPIKPYKPGRRISWNFETGLTTTLLPFKPAGEKTMANYIRADKGGNLLDVEAFYARVKAAPKSVSRVLLRAFSKGDKSAIYSGEFRDRFGTYSRDGNFAASACGDIIEGDSFYCSSDPALVFWEAKTGKFYFATNYNEDNYIYPERLMKYMQFDPPLAEWPDGAKELFQSWQKKETWDRSH